MKTKIILLTMLLQSLICISQSITPFIGYKSAEIDFTIEKELIYGIGGSLVDSKLVSQRATNNDGAHKIHKSNSKLVPSLFFLIGGEIEGIIIIGKLGCAYYDQSINEINESQKFYRSVGVSLGYKSIFMSYDSSNSMMLGYKINL